MLWSGAVVDIPTGWVLCDGNNGTPDLRDKFVVGAGNSYNPGDTGGSGSHIHSYTAPSHFHALLGGTAIAAGSDYHFLTTPEVIAGNVDSSAHLPYYHALCYIMLTG